MAQQLRTAVEVEGRWYRAGDRPGEEIPAGDVEKIRNPKVWEYTDGTKPERNPVKPVGAQLVKRVDVDGVWYGPGDEVPADVAAKIRNPKVWEDGKVPDTTEPAAAEQAPATGEAGATPGRPAPAEDKAKAADAGDTEQEQQGDDADGKPSARRGRRS